MNKIRYNYDKFNPWKLLFLLMSKSLALIRYTKQYNVPKPYEKKIKQFRKISLLTSEKLPYITL